MADKANLILDSGELTEVLAQDLDVRDKDAEYRCCGKVGGRCCGARLSLVIGVEKTNYFAARDASQKHIALCPYDESPDSKYRRIYHIDMTGAGASPENCLEAFCKNRKKAPGGNKTGGGGGKLKPDTPGDEQNAEQNERIVRGKRNPNNLSELVQVLSFLDVNDSYAGVRVGEYMIDHRSIPGHRRNGLRDGQIAIAICRRTKMGGALRQRENEVVLSDGFTQGGDPLYFVFSIDRLGGKKIFKDAGAKDKVAIFAEWHCDSERANVYRAEFVDSRCIEVVSEEMFSEN